MLASPRAQEHVAGEGASVPLKMDDLEADLHMIFQHVGKKFDDVDGIGFVKYRCRVYIVRDTMKDFLMYLDELLAWRKTYENDVFGKISYDMKVYVHCTEEVGLIIDEKADELKVSMTMDSSLSSF